MSLFEDNIQDDPASNFTTRASQLAQRRKLAQDLIARGMSGNNGSGFQGGKVFIVGNPLGGLAQSLAGTYMQSQADKDQSVLANEQAQAQTDWSGRYGKATPEQQQGLLVEARNKGLKYDLEQAFAKEQADRIERGEQAAAERQNRADIAEANRIDQGEQKAADRVSRQELRATPTIHITNSGNGGGSDLDRQIKEARLAQLTAPKPLPADKPLTEAQGNAYLFGTRADAAHKVLDEVGSDYSPMKLDIKRGAERVPGGAAVVNATLSPKEQRVEQAQRDFINAILRKESGAAISASEFDNARKQYFQQPNDSAGVIAQKKANRELAIKGLAKIVGPQGKDIGTSVTGAGSSKQVVREVKLKDGRIGVEYSDGTRGFK